MNVAATPQARETRAGRNVLILAVILGLAGLVLPFFAAIPGLISTALASRVLRRQQKTVGATSPAIFAVIIGGMTLALGVTWFSVALLVSGTAIFTGP